MNKHAIDFIEYVENEGNGEYKVLSEYKRSADKIKMKHVTCGNVYKVTPNKFKMGRRCPKCALERRGKARMKNSFDRHIKELDDPEYEFVGEFKGMFKKAKFFHKKCGLTYEALPANFVYNGHRCPNEECLRERKSKGQSWTIDIFKNKVRELAGKEYTVLGEYINGVTPIKIKHNNCGHVYEVTPGNFIHHGRRCPRCQYSRGEKRVENFLLKKGFRYYSQYRFPDCRLSYPLPFDFVVFDSDNKITYAIEYDGEFHFHQKFRTDEEFYLQKRRDKIKNSYCKEKGIKLIRIPYQQFNKIEKVLSNKMHK